LDEQGIVHRDVKPSNLLLDAKGSVRLVDFGSLALRGRQKIPSLDEGPAGTPSYMAPERLLREAATPAADLYSLGLVLYEIVSSRHRSCSGGKALDGTCSRVPPRLDRIPSGVSRELSTLLASLLSPDPRRRPNAWQALSMLGLPPAPPPPRASVIRRTAHASSRPAGAARWLASRLDRIRDGFFGAYILEGGTRSGKTAELHAAHELIQSQGGLVLPACGRSDERTSFNVLDRAIDGLAAVLLEIPLDGQLGVDVRNASSVFPVLAGARANPRTRWRDAFDALIRILASLAGSDGVYLSVDDLHWADGDSMELLDRILQCKPAGVGLLATVNTDIENPVLLRWLDTQRCIERKELGSRAEVSGREIRCLSMGKAFDHTRRDH
jgi:hypothetical protein